MAKHEGMQTEGSWVTLRDSKGNLVTRVRNRGENDRENWKAIARRLTNNGENQLIKLADISEGRPFIAKLPDGRESEPIIPTLQLQAVTSQILLEMIHGKAVAQTEVSKAEEDMKAVEKYRSLSDAELRAKVVEALEARKSTNAIPERVPEPEGSNPLSDE